MTRKNFILLFLVQWLLWTAVKVWVYDYRIFANPGAQQLLFWLLTGLVFIAVIRRFGVISIFEAGLAMFVWTAADLFLDLIVTSKLAGLGIFSSPPFWYGYVVMLACVGVFHKKRHIHIRHQMHAAKHAQEGHKH